MQSPLQKKKNFFFTYLFLAALGLHCCAGAFSSCGERELLSSWGARASYCNGFSSCGAQAAVEQLQLMGSRARTYLFHSMWNLPEPGIKPVSPALASRFFTTGSPGKSLANFSNI